MSTNLELCPRFNLQDPHRQLGIYRLHGFESDMKLLPKRNLILMLLATCGVVENCHAINDWEKHPEWSGAWKLGPNVGEILGFDSQEKSPTLRSNLQLEFCASKGAAYKVLGKQSIDSAQSMVERMGHKIVAAGRWKDPTKGDTSSICFVTEKSGAMYLWFGDQSESMTFAKVHYIRGATPEDDLLILDLLGAFPQRLRGKKYVDTFRPTGYRRQKD